MSTTTPPAAETSANGAKKTPNVIAGTNLPAPSADSKVDVKAKMKDGSILDYEADARDVPVETLKSATPQRSETPNTDRSQFLRGTRYTELDEWLEYWREYAEEDDGSDVATDVRRFKISVTREADVMIPGMATLYNTPCPTRRFLGRYSFPLEPNQFIGQLQAINGNSGGEFYVTVIDGSGQSIKETWFRQLAYNKVAPVEGQQNGTWGGAIPNPVNVQGEKKERESKGPRTAKEFLRELKDEIDDLKAIGLIPEKTEGSNNSLLDTVNATAAASVVTKMAEAISAVTEASSKHTGGEDKGFFRSLAESDEGRSRIFGGVDNVVSLLAGVAGDYLQGRRDLQREKMKLERLKLIKENPQLANVKDDEEPATPLAREDIYDFVMRKCEESDLSFNIVTDSYVATLPETEKSLVFGALKKDSPAEDVLGLFIKICTMKGKGERAEALRVKPQTLQFIQRLQSQVRGATAG